MKIGELSTRTGVTVEALRFYERERLIAPRRRNSGYREFAAEDVERIRFVARGKALGFSLREVRELLELDAVPDATSGEGKEALREKLRQVGAKIANLQQIRSALERLECSCEETDVRAESPILRYMKGVPDDSATSADTNPTRGAV
jgi:DNA-binding transcriptional MerR regulator